jgi:hypothetical protein
MIDREQITEGDYEAYYKGYDLPFAQISHNKIFVRVYRVGMKLRMTTQFILNPYPRFEDVDIDDLKIGPNAWMFTKRLEDGILQRDVPTARLEDFIKKPEDNR